MKFKTDIDACQNEFKNAVLENLPVASAPATPVKGQFYYDVTNDAFKVWNGTTWVNYKPTSAFSFSSSTNGNLTIIRKINESAQPITESIKIVDPNAFEEAGAAAQAYASAKIYTDNEISNLLGGAPSEALDTIFELAQAVEDNQDLIATLQALITNGVHIAKIFCPALTPTNGVCTWVCNHGLSLSGNDTAVLCDVYTSGGEKMLCDITINSRSNVIIKISSDTTITAGSYYAVVVG